MDAAELADRFALGRVPRLSDGPVGRGKQGAVWRLDTADGARAVKVAFRTVTDDEVHAGALFQEAAVAAGVPAPRLRRTRDGAVLAEVSGARMPVEEWVDVLGPDPLLDPALVGTVLAGLHRVPATGLGAVSGWYQDPIGAERWDDLLCSLFQAGAPFAGRLADLRDELVALESWIELPQLLQTCHRDLWADNLLPTAGGGVCVLDWEDSGPADPHHELGCVLFEFGRTDPSRARALVGAYGAAGGPAAVDQRGHFSMLVAQLGHITQTAACDWLEPNLLSPDRAGSAAWVAEVLDDPHRRAVLDALLAVVRG
ncbi:MAG: Ser/Thr protein kinase RdoA involved in Cpx stress response, MazF antagonist [Frankiales bacterium]|nr:Ser/Thr protein kinase RdoA involved in Cpx stress response, MazF antagonist [Frankiales bacterium]